MLYYLSLLSAHWGPLNVFRYETFRAMAAALTAFMLSLAMGPKTIVLLTRLKLGQPLRLKSEVRELADLHSAKIGYSVNLYASLYQHPGHLAANILLDRG